MYVGCYKDDSITNPVQRDLEVYLNQDDKWKDMTLARCLGACATLGYRYAGMAVS